MTITEKCLNGKSTPSPNTSNSTKTELSPESQTKLINYLSSLNDELFEANSKLIDTINKLLDEQSQDTCKKPGTSTHALYLSFKK